MPALPLGHHGPSEQSACSSLCCLFTDHHRAQPSLSCCTAYSNLLLYRRNSDGKQPKNMTSVWKNRGSWAGLAPGFLLSHTHMHRAWKEGKCPLPPDLDLIPQAPGTDLVRGSGTSTRRTLPKETPCKHPREPLSRAPPATAAPAPHACSTTARCTVPAPRTRREHCTLQRALHKRCVLQWAPHAARALPNARGTARCSVHCPDAGHCPTPGAEPRGPVSRPG